MKFEGNKVSERNIAEAIVKEEFIKLPDGKTTIALLTLDNGYTVRGEAACVDPANFNEAMGEDYARQDAHRKVWALLGFRLADHLKFAKEASERVKRQREKDAFDTLPDDYETGDH